MSLYKYKIWHYNVLTENFKKLDYDGQFHGKQNEAKWVMMKVLNPTKKKINFKT